MLHETKAKTLLKKIIRKALLDPNIVIIVRDEEGERMNKKVKDIKEIIDMIKTRLKPFPKPSKINKNE